MTSSSQRLALGIRYRGTDYQGWQSQPSGRTVQDRVEAAIEAFVGAPVATVCSGRTDSGVHAMQQVVHIDPPVERDACSWVRATNRYLPSDIAVQWCQPVASDFHARNSARTRTYRYVCLESLVRPSIEAGMMGWVHRPLDEVAMQAAAKHLIGEHDFSSFRSAECQSPSPIKRMLRIEISRIVTATGLGASTRWSFEFEAQAFLHHMVRNIMGCLVAVGEGRQMPAWVLDVLSARDRRVAAPTFSADGLYFLGASYDVDHRLPAPSRPLF